MSLSESTQKLVTLPNVIFHAKEKPEKKATSGRNNFYEHFLLCILIIAWEFKEYIFPSQFLVNSREGVDLGKNKNTFKRLVHL